MTQTLTDRDVLAYLHVHPAAITEVSKVLQWSCTHPGRPFGWSDVRVAPVVLNRLVLDGLLDRVGRGLYVVPDVQPGLRALSAYRAQARAARAAASVPGAAPAPPPGAPPGLFDELVGYEDAKRITLMALSAPAATHILYTGAPASGKSLFMEAISSLPGAVYRFGDAVTKAGLRSLLLNEKPPYLCIDEIDKMAEEESSALLEFMERQRVSQLNYRSNREEKVDIRVFAAANRTERMRPELLSRFWKMPLAAYTFEEFIRVVNAHLQKKGVPPDLANYIATGVGERTRDVRDAVRIANMARSPTDARFLMANLGRETSV